MNSMKTIKNPKVAIAHVRNHRQRATTHGNQSSTAINGAGEATLSQ
jgi:hypothetical protein